MSPSVCPDAGPFVHVMQDPGIQHLARLFETAGNTGALHAAPTALGSPASSLPCSETPASDLVPHAKAAAAGERDHAYEDTDGTVRFPVCTTANLEHLEGKVLCYEADVVAGTAEAQPAAPRGACEPSAPPQSADAQPVGHASLAGGQEALLAAQVQPVAVKGVRDAIGAPDSAATQPAVHASLAATGRDLSEGDCAAERFASACAPVKDAGAASRAAEISGAVTNLPRLPPGGERLSHPAVCVRSWYMGNTGLLRLAKALFEVSSDGALHAQRETPYASCVMLRFQAEAASAGQLPAAATEPRA